MDQMFGFYKDNLDCWIDAVAGRSESLIDLGVFSHQAAAGERNCVAGLLVHVPHFQALGVVRSANGAPVMQSPDGQWFSMTATMLHLFGRFGRWTPSEVLSAPFGAGRWDETLLGCLARPCRHKELALARLRRARSILEDHLVDLPGVGPCTVEPEVHRHCQKLLSLIALVEGGAFDDGDFLDAVDTTSDTDQAGLAQLVARIPGVAALEPDGEEGIALATTDTTGGQCQPQRVWNRMLAEYEDLVAFDDALFNAHGLVACSSDILQWWGGTPTRKELTLARLYFSLEQYTGVSSPQAPLPPRDRIKQVVAERLCEFGWSKIEAPSCVAKKRYRTAVGTKEAHAYLSIGDGYHYTLSGWYESEGSNVLASPGVLIPIGATIEQAQEMADVFALGAEKAVAGTYAVKLLSVLQATSGVRSW